MTALITIFAVMILLMAIGVTVYNPPGNFKWLKILGVLSAIWLLA